MQSEDICLSFPQSHTYNVRGSLKQACRLGWPGYITSCSHRPLAVACLFFIKCCFLLFLTMAPCWRITAIPLQCLNSRTWRGDSSFKFVLSWVLSFSPRNGFFLVSTIITKNTARCWIITYPYISSIKFVRIIHYIIFIFFRWIYCLISYFLCLYRHNQQNACNYIILSHPTY